MDFSGPAGREITMERGQGAVKVLRIGSIKSRYHQEVMTTFAKWQKAAGDWRETAGTAPVAASGWG